MAVIQVVLSDGVKRISYDAASQMVTVYYATGAVDYFQNVAWGDFSTVAASTTPLAAVKTTLQVSKYRVVSGAHG